MIKKVGVLTISLVLIITVGFLSFSQSSRASDMVMISVVERATTDVVTDLGPEGDSVGDILTFANEIYDEANETMVGTDNGYCVRTAVGVAWECIWTMTLEDGSIMVEGPFMDVGDSQFAITGGTGVYMNARGQMTLSARNPEATEYSFVYELYPEN